MIPLIKNNGNKKTILLVGETGAGKSSVGNLILGREEFIVSDEVDSCTMTTVKKTSSIDPSIEVIDTPGLIDTQGRDKIHNEQMIEYIKSLNENDKNNFSFVVIDIISIILGTKICWATCLAFIFFLFFFFISLL